jgi:hypothetical protein
LQKENSKLLEVAIAIERRDLTIIANLRAEDIVAVIFKVDVHATKAEIKHKLKLSEDRPSKKRSRLN